MGPAESGGAIVKVGPELGRHAKLTREEAIQLYVQGMLALQGQQ